MAMNGKARLKNVVIVPNDTTPRNQSYGSEFLNHCVPNMMTADNTTPIGMMRNFHAWALRKIIELHEMRSVNVVVGSAFKAGIFFRDTMLQVVVEDVGQIRGVGS